MEPVRARGLKRIHDWFFFARKSEFSRLPRFLSLQHKTQPPTTLPSRHTSSGVHPHCSISPAQPQARQTENRSPRSHAVHSLITRSNHQHIRLSLARARGQRGAFCLIGTRKHVGQIRSVSVGAAWAPGGGGGRAGARAVNALACVRVCTATHINRRVKSTTPITTTTTKTTLQGDHRLLARRPPVPGGVCARGGAQGGARGRRPRHRHGRPW